MDKLTQITETIQSNDMLKDIMVFFIIFVVLYVLRKIILDLLFKRLQDQSRWWSVKSFAIYMQYFLLIVAAVLLFFDNNSGITTTLGLAGAGITFALREVIVSIAGWFGIVFGDLFSIGDRIEMGNVKGDVIHFGIMRTTLMEIGDWISGDQYNGKIVRVSNSNIFTSPIFNYTSDFNFIWDEIKIPVTYDSDYKRARTLLKETADQIIGDYPVAGKENWNLLRRRYKLQYRSLDPVIYMTADDRYVEFCIRYIVNAQLRSSTKDRLYEKILDAFKEHKDHIRIATQSIEIIQHNNEKISTVD